MPQIFKKTSLLTSSLIDILKIRAQTIQTARQWFKLHNYLEIQGPIIIPAKKEWPDYLSTKIFNKTANLAQGLQPYDQALVEKFKKIYAFQPTFRLEKKQSQNHLLEYWRIEVAQKTQLEEVIKSQENLIEYICQDLSKIQNVSFLLKEKLKRLEKIKAPFKRITYEKAIKILQKKGVEIFWGQTIEKESEIALSHMFNKPFFITELPFNDQTFFYETLKEKPQQTKSADLIAPEGFTELSSSAQRIANKTELGKKMQEIQVNPQDQKWYLNLTETSNSPQSGFALGFERLIQWMCKLRNIKQTTPYPRTNKCIYP